VSKGIDVALQALLLRSGFVKWLFDGMGKTTGLVTLSAGTPERERAVVGSMERKEKKRKERNEL